jgi:hypothetical protein
LISMSATARPAVSLRVAPVTLDAPGASGSQALDGMAIHAGPAANKATATILRKRAMRRLCAGVSTPSSEGAIFPRCGPDGRAYLCSLALATRWSNWAATASKDSFATPSSFIAYSFWSTTRITQLPRFGMTMPDA